MISYDEALQIVLKAASTLESDYVPLENLLGRTLAEPVVSPHDLPLFDNSAVDGFGVMVADVRHASPEQPVSLRNIGTIAAGSSEAIAITSGTAVKLLTGAPIPPGVDAVVMKEFTESQNGSVQMLRSVNLGDNIRRRGEEFRKGDNVLPIETKVTPPVLGLLASLGYAGFKAYRQPKVAVVVTGNELVKPGNALQPGQIYESNSVALLGALASLGIEGSIVYHSGDESDSLREKLAQALQHADVIITSGGVSVGEYDLVKTVLAELGVVSRFWKVAIKPGKPVYFGTLPLSPGSPQEKLVFGLPGNPVAVLLTFHLLVRPALLKQMGVSHHSLATFQATLTQAIRKKPGRLEFVRGVLSNNDGALAVIPTLGQGSHMLGGLSRANCLITFPMDASQLDAGQSVDVELLEWS